MRAKKARKSRNNQSVRRHKNNVDELLSNALALHQNGHLQIAEGVYQNILQQQPGHPDALHLLGVIAYQVGKNETAVELINQAIRERADFTVAYNNLGNAFMGLGHYQEAMQSFQQALNIKADYPEALNNLGVTLEKLNRYEEAIDYYDQALALQPGYIDALKNKGLTLHALHRYDEAVQCYLQVLKHKPDYGEIYNYLGNSYVEISQHNIAIECYQKVLSLQPDNFEVHNNLGNVLQYIGDNETALKHYDTAIRMKPDFIEAWNNKGRVLQDMGKLDDAIHCFENVLELKPDFSETLHNLSVVKPESKQITIIETLLKEAKMDNDKMHLHYAQANLLKRSGQHENVFDHYSKANDLKRKTLKHDEVKHTAYINQLIETFSKEYFTKKSTTGNDSQLPVFIVGMPRSGTTLVEQILSSHPQVYGAGELNTLSNIENSLGKNSVPSGPYPECLTHCEQDIINEYAEYYLNEIQKMASDDSIHITDKMPNNFLRVGLIKSLFPNAYIIHCKRNPLDTCFSIYTNYFARGNEYTYDLKELGRYYLDYERLMSHWQKLFPGQIYDIQYEDLVMNQETLSKQLIDHLELDWNEQCLAFHKNKRAVKTASNLQVRKPMYTASINRWKNFEQQLMPLREVLGL